ncbi:cupin domain-containing protein [bacterium]|nr:cupin domain-containing protein [bacterium]
MAKLMKSIFVLFVMILCVTNISYSAQKEVLLKTTSTWDSAEYKKLNIKNPEATVLRIIINVNEELPMHKHDLVNIAYVKKGTLTVVTDDNKEITLREGEVLPELVGKYHYGKNTGNEPVELIVFYLGQKGTPLSVNK